MDDDDGFDLLRGYGVYVHLCTVQIGADRGRAEYMVRAATTQVLIHAMITPTVAPFLHYSRFDYSMVSELYINAIPLSLSSIYILEGEV